MEKIYLIWVLLFLTACNTAIMTPEGFERIQPGTPMEQVEAEFGSPYSSENLTNGFQEYTYVQRIPIAKGVVDQVTYILYVCKGKVMSKNIKTDQSVLDLNYQ